VRWQRRVQKSVADIVESHYHATTNEDV
jgi:hypothetical protein